MPVSLYEANGMRCLDLQSTPPDPPSLLPHPAAPHDSDAGYAKEGVSMSRHAEELEARKYRHRRRLLSSLGIAPPHGRLAVRQR